jgi:replicative DNA helicase Mcm
MAKASANADLVERFDSFYRNYYEEAISELAQRYPNDQRSLYVDYDDLYRFDVDLAEDYRTQPEQMQEYAEEALRQFDLPADVKLGRAHVRLRNLSDAVDIRDIRVHDDHIGRLVEVRGIVRKATDVRPKIVEAAFECQRCGTMTYIPQSDGSFQEPHECQGCERQGPFRVNHDQSEFVDSQQIRVQESPEGLRGGETPQHIDVNLEDDVTGKVTAGDHVAVVGVLHIEQMEQGQEKSAVFELYMDGVSVQIEDEEFEDMEISTDDVQEILALSQDPDIYDQMVASIAPTIYGYEEEKFAMVLQLFSGVTKHLPDKSRIRGDMHLLLIGDPGTGKCLKSDTNVVLGDGSERAIGELVESRLDDPVPVDDGVYQPVDFSVQSVTTDGRIVSKRATKVWKREAPERMYRIRTESGREVEVTPSHPLFVQDGLGLEPRQAEELTTGEFVALPRCLRGEWDDSLSADPRRAQSTPAHRIDVPDGLTPELGRLLGYVIGEGDVSETGSSASVVVTNADDAVLTDCLDSLDLHWWRTPHPEAEGVELVGCSSVEFADFLREIEPAIFERSSQQRVPDVLFRASPPVKRAFLRAYIERESHVSTNEQEITVASMSRELLDGVRSLLLAFDVDGSISPRQNSSYRLRISGADLVSYVDEIGFVTGQKRRAATAFDNVPQNPNPDVVPNLSDDLHYLRETLALSQYDCGVPRSTYQRYERGHRSPSRDSLEQVVEAFEARLEWFRDANARIETGDWTDVVALREELNLSQATLAAGMGVEQTAVSYYERHDVVPDGGAAGAKAVVAERIDRALSVASGVAALRDLVESDLSWDRIDTIEQVEPSEEWVYDLEVGGTHTYLSNGLVSHNSQMLSYIRKIAPRSVYTSGKGSSSAGLCVTGDTLVHTADGFRPIETIVSEEIPDSVEMDTAAERPVSVHTLNRETDAIERRDSSHVWRMPEKPCRRIETEHGKTVEASQNTPVLTYGDDGIEWTPVSEVEPSDYVAVPRYDDSAVDRTEIDVRDYLELTNEKVRLADASVTFLRRELREEFGSLRDAAAKLGLSEDLVYDTLSTRHVPLAKLDTVLDAVGATRADVEIERLMFRHGDSIAVPETFDEDLMYLLGLVFGDGEIALDCRDGTRGMVRISNGDESVLRRAADVFAAQFDKRVEIERQETRVPCIQVNSATIARLFANAGMQTPKVDLRLDPALTTAAHADAFLRGLMDADGWVSSHDRGGSGLILSTISEELARQVQLMLETYGVRARRRERDRRGTYELADGQTIESEHVQHFVEIYGADVDRYAEQIGFEVEAKRTALRELASDGGRRGDTIPVGAALAQVDGSSGAYYQNVHRGDNPSRGHARAMLNDIDLGPVESVVETAVEADLRWDRVVSATDTGEKEVFDLTVPGTHNFVGNGVVTHNTAAAVRDDFGEGQQWTLEAGALVLADKGIAAVDELDKMRCVTGETLVHGADGIERIRDIAIDEARDGDIESLPTGRTIRDIDDREVWTMTDDGRLVTRPVEAIHEYEAPTELCRVTLDTGEQLTATDDHPFFIREGGERVKRATADLEPGDWVYVPRDAAALATDGGGAVATPGNSAGLDVLCRRVASVESVPVSGLDDCSHVYDLTVAGTHNFVANGMIVHNSEDRSAMHQALEQQEISVSKAGINATLKSRCSLLGAANPRYGRFDPYEPIGEQIDLEPALISRFDLIFTVQDKPDEEHDAKLAEHILNANYAGELSTQRDRMTNPEFDDEEIETVTQEVEPAIEPELFRKYIAYAKRECFPSMSEAARERIKQFYVDLRAKGTDEDAPVPITARKLEALVRLAEASARVRLSDTVTEEDAERVVELVRSCLQDIGVDPETGEFDADVVETGTSKTQRDRIKNVKALIQDIEDEYEEGAPVDEVLARADEVGIDRSKAEKEIENLKKKGELYEPSLDHLRTT